jgi:hypothetical protein
MCESDGGLIIQVKNDGVFEWVDHFSEEMTEPNKFLCSVHNRKIFSFDGG